MAKVIVSVGGGIAAYKTATLVSRLVQQNHNVHVVLTASGQQFIGAATFAALTNNTVSTAGFDDSMPLGPHIELPDGADLMIIAPATARILASCAHGLADDLTATIYLNRTCPVLLAPAMSNSMWEKAAVQRNVAQLVDDGVHFVGPNEGWLSCRRLGAGRMAEPEEILEAALKILANSTSDSGTAAD